MSVLARSTDRKQTTFIPVDPFKPSLAFSVANTVGRESHWIDHDDVYSRPIRRDRLAKLQKPAQPSLPPIHQDQRYSGGSGVLGSSVIEELRIGHIHYAASSGNLQSLPASSSSDVFFSAIESEMNSTRLSTSPPEASIVNESLNNREAKPASGQQVDSPMASPYSHPRRYYIHQERMMRPTIIRPPSVITAAQLPVSTYLLVFVADTLPRQIYLHLLLRLPYLYFSRVARIFEEADMTMPQIKEGILEAAMQMEKPFATQRVELEMTMENAQFINLQTTWKSFIDSLIREWKTLNIISVLLLSAILTILQINDAANDPLTRYSALVSMLCALMSLIYGCIYIVHFGTMRKTYKAAEWANEAKKTRQYIFWNVWVLLAMPTTWLAWSLIFFVVSVMSFIWRTGTVESESQALITNDQALAARITVTLVLCLGLVYFGFITFTLRKYGEIMDRAWHERIIGWVNETQSLNTAQYAPSRVATPRSPPENPLYGAMGEGNSYGSWIPWTPKPNDGVTPESSLSSLHKPLVKMQTILSDISKENLWSEHWSTQQSAPASGLEVKLSLEQMEAIVSDITRTWNVDELDMDKVQPVIEAWNRNTFHAMGGQVFLCHDLKIGSLPYYSLVYFTCTGPLPTEEIRYESLPPGLLQRDIFNAIQPDSSSSPIRISKISLSSSRVHEEEKK